LNRYLLKKMDGVAVIFLSDGLTIDQRGVYVLGWDKDGMYNSAFPLLSLIIW